MLQREYTTVYIHCQPLSSNNKPKSAVSLVEISSAQINQRLDNFLARRLGNVPRSRIYRIIRKGEVRVNKKRSKPDYKLQAGDRVRIPPLRIDSTASNEARIPPTLLGELEAAILFENEHVIVIDKPSGLAVHAGSSVRFGVIDAMRRLRPGVDVELVHRIDRDTSGCLLLAKHRAALLAMQQALKDGSLHKNYFAVVKGSWPPERTLLQHSLKKYHLPNGERRVRVDAAGKPATSRVAVVKSGPFFSIIRVEILTGRTHQIRVQCQTEGHPIAGDDKYGDASFNRAMRGQGFRRLMLHASSLELPAGEFTPEKVVNAALPLEFERLFAGDNLPDPINHNRNRPR